MEDFDENDPTNLYTAKQLERLRSAAAEETSYPMAARCCRTMLLTPDDICLCGATAIT